jgi:predicted small secreted protein
MKTMRRWILTASVGLLFLAAACGSGCNTAQGFGKDVEKAGEKIQEGTD